MNYRFLNTISDMLAAALNYIVVLTVWAIINAVGGMQDHPILMLLFAFVPVILYLVRLHVGGFFLFTLIHVLIPVLGVRIFASSIGDKVAVGIVLTALSVVSYVVSLKSDEVGEPELSPILAGVIMFAAIMIIGFADAARPIYIPKLALIYAALYLPYMYIQKLMWYEFINSKTVSNIPTAESLKIGGPIVCGIAAFYGITAFVGLDENLIAKISAFIRSFLMIIAKGMLSGDSEREPGSFTPTEGAEMSGGEIEWIPTDYEPSPVLLFLEKAAIYIVIVGTTAALLGIFAFLLISAIRRLAGRQPKKHVKIMEDFKETREKIERKDKTKILSEIFSEDSYSIKIRKLYKKIVRKNVNLTDRPYLFTVRSFAGLFDEEEREYAKRFAVVYEKARYSKGQCTKEDYLEAKHCTSYII